MALPKDEVFLDVPWVTIRWDSQHNCVYTEWKDFANSDEYRGALGAVLSAIKVKQAVACLSDTRKVKVIAPDDQKWVNDVWIPRIAGTGVKRYAVVVAGSGLGRMTVEETIKMVRDKRLQIRTFESVPTALEWITAGI